MLLTATALLLFPALMAYAAVSDLLTMTISNRISLILIAGFFAMAICIGMEPMRIAMHVGAGSVVLIVGFACFAFGWIGGGDAKLAAATALWFGFDQVFDYLLVSSILGGGLTLALLAVRNWPLPPFMRYPDWVLHLHHPKTGIPYGIALAAAGLIIYPSTEIMRAVGLAG